MGSIGITNAISSFSNTGSCVDIYAPGENVLSAWNTGNNTVQYLDGTSMATPHVTGVMAYLMAANATLAADPAAMKQYLQTSALTKVVTGNVDSPDAMSLLNNGETATLTTRAVERDLFDIKRDIASSNLQLVSDESTQVV